MSASADGNEQKWAEDIGLELELFDDLILVDCKSRADVNIYLKSSIEKKEKRYTIKVMRGSEILMQRRLGLYSASALQQLVKDFKKELNKKPIPPKAGQMPPKVSVSEPPLQLESSADPKVEEVSMTHTEAMVANHQEIIPSRWLTSAGASCEVWNYHWILHEHEDESVALPSIKTKPFPGVRANIEWWAYPWLGFEINGGAGLTAFRMHTIGASSPEESSVWVRQYLGAGAILFRYLLTDGLSLSFKSGYRFWGAQTDVQRIGENHHALIPTFAMHALEIGAQARYETRRKETEISLSLAALPYVFYKDSIDMSDRLVIPLGMSAQFLIRHHLGRHWFFTFDIRGHGIYKAHSRATLLSYSVAASAGLGWSF